MIELYQSTFNPDYIYKAIELTDTAVSLFWDESDGGFFFSSRDNFDLIAKPKEIYDGAIPSGNSIMMMNLRLLSNITLNNYYEELSEKMMGCFSETVSKLPFGSTMFLNAFDFMLGPSTEVIIAGNNISVMDDNFLLEMNKQFIPNKVVLVKNQSKEPVIDYLGNYNTIEDRTAYYICKNHICSLPTTEIKIALSYLKDQK